MLRPSGVAFIIVSVVGVGALKIGVIGRYASRECGDAPQLGDDTVDNVISSSAGALLLGIRNMRCLDAARDALASKSAIFTEVNFDGPPEYVPGESPVWDWLHCKYQPDDEQGTTMHSYVFVDGEFIGEGFAASEKLLDGQLDSKLATSSCEDQYADEAAVVNTYMANTSTKVLLFGWIQCSCTGIAESRFAAKSLCYEGRTWANPTSKLMSYLQCKQQDTQSHSFVYFYINGQWLFQGNGFMFDEKTMSNEDLDNLITAADAPMTCQKANVLTNVYGEPLEECRADASDMSGSWMDDGKCTETSGGVHQICIENLPADFSTETHQDAWSQERVDMRHCVCIGAWSLYMTDAANHTVGAENIMPHCSSIPETALTKTYLENWKDWNGYPAEIKIGVNELASRCLSVAPSPQASCGLKQRFEALEEEVQELQDADELASLRQSLDQLDCSSSLLQMGVSRPAQYC